MVTSRRHPISVMFRLNIIEKMMITSIHQGSRPDLLHPGALEYSHITPTAHDAQQPPSTSRPRSAPAPARPPVHRRGA